MGVTKTDTSRETPRAARRAIAMPPESDRGSRPIRSVQSIQPWIEDLNSGRLEVVDVARNNGHSVFQRGCGDQGIALRDGLGDMQARTSARDGRVDSQHPISKSRNDVAIQPGAQDSALCLIAPLQQQHAQFQLQYRNGREKEMAGEYAGCPRRYVLVGLSGFGFAQLRYDIGIQYEHQKKSAGR